MDALHFGHAGAHHVDGRDHVALRRVARQLSTRNQSQNRWKYGHRAKPGAGTVRLGHWRGHGL